VHARSLFMLFGNVLCLVDIQCFWAD